MIPAALPFAVLALAAYRSWRLLALDTLPPLVRARDWALGYEPCHDEVREIVGPLPGESHSFSARTGRPLVAEWLTCPWCSGLWISAAWYVAWLAWPSGSLYGAAPLALSALVGLIDSTQGE